MAGFDVNVSYVFLHGLLEAITFGVGLVSDGGARVCAGCEMGLPLCSVAVIILLWVGSALQMLE